MDAKPQRPVRTLRVYDENAPPTTAAQKTIHQRNKSSPALSSMAQAGALKAVAKRTAFGDLSNTVNAVRSSRDDSVIGSRMNNKAKENIPLAQDKKQTAFQKPAQRPMSVNGFRAPLSNATNIHPAAKQPLADIKNNIPKTTNIHVPRITSKKSTTVFRDNPPAATQPSSKDPGITVPKPSHQSSAPIPPVHRELPPLPTAPKLPKISEAKREKMEIFSDALESQDDLNKVSTSDTVDQENIPSSSIEEVQMHEKRNIAVHGAPNTLEEHIDRIKAVQVSSLPKTTHHVSKVPLVDHGSNYIFSSSTHVDPHKRPRLAPVSEPEEYWVEEPVENYDEDGYVTARSFKSRAESTTGVGTTVLFPKQNQNSRKEIAIATELVEGSKTVEEIEDEMWDTTMVAEYSEDIFQYMRELEVRMLPNAHYMDNQLEIQWSMRAVLMDWIVQVHHRFNLLPETLFLTVNYIDRFLSAKVVSLGKLQLVGATAIFIAAKYEEIDCPSVQEIVFMVDRGYTVDEILKAERFMLTMLQFELGWPGPMSFLRRVSKADDYDLETRTLAKYFLEITIMDERFVGSPPSFVAAAAHCLARMMLQKGSWSPSHVYYSNYTYSQLYCLVMLMVECCEDPRRHHCAVYDKYLDKRYKRASYFAESEMRRGFQPHRITNNLALPQQSSYVPLYDLEPQEVWCNA